MAPNIHRRDYEPGRYTMPMAAPRQRPSSSRHSWPSYRFSEFIDKQGNSEETMVCTVMNPNPKRFLSGRKKPTYFNPLGGLRSRTKKIIGIYLSFYVASCLLFSPIVYQGMSATESSAKNPILSFLGNSIRGGAYLGSSTGDLSEEDRFAGDPQDDEQEYFSACIMWMDDNHRLEEWLAYHYYLLKLRYVVINVDPRSTTSPQAIVDRWNGKNKIYNAGPNYPLDYDLNMTIVLWNDTTYIPPMKYEFEQAKIDGAEGDEKYRLATEYHKLRQPAFYRACTEHLISERTKLADTGNNSPSQWTAYHDTDEFLAFTPEESNHEYETPGYVLKRLNAIKKQKIHEEEEKRRNELEENQKQQQEVADTDNNNNKNAVATMDANEVIPPQSGASCLVVPRYRICSKELTDEETNELLDVPPQEGHRSPDVLVPPEFVREKSLLENRKRSHSETAAVTNGTAIVRRFDTLRYKYQTPGLANYGKSILDLSQADVQEFMKTQAPFQTHGVIASVCGTPAQKIRDDSRRHRSTQQKPKNQALVDQEHLQLNHYLGSWESYNARPNDARKGLSTSGNGSTSAKWGENSKSYQNWLRKSQDTRGRETTVARPWLQGFIRLVGGPRIAAHLLQDAGMIFAAPPPLAEDNEGGAINE